MIKSNRIKGTTVLIAAILILSMAMVYVSGDKMTVDPVTLDQQGVDINTDASVNNSIPQEQVLNSEDTYIKNLSIETGKNKIELEQLKAKLGNWEDVKIKLNADQYIKEIDKNKLSEDKIRGLHQKGYIVGDILIAQRLSPLCGKSVEEILAVKGKSNKYAYSTVKDNEGQEKKVITTMEEKNWDSVLQEMGVNTETIEKKLGIPATKLNEIKQSMTTVDIIDIALLSAMSDKGYSSALSELEQFKKSRSAQQEVQTKQRDEMNGKITVEARPEQDTEAKIQEHLITTYKITNAEIQLCKQNGIGDIRDIAYSKSLSNKYNISIMRIVELKKNKGNWEEVVKELEGNK